MERNHGNFFSLSLDEQEELVLGLEHYHKYSEGNTKAITKEELSNLETPIVQAIFKFLMADPDAHKVPFKAECFLRAIKRLKPSESVTYFCNYLMKFSRKMDFHVDIISGILRLVDKH